MLTGACLCGDIAFEVDGSVEIVGHCHCSRCRKAVSAAYQTVLRVDSSGFRWLAGGDNIVSYRMPGTCFQCAFCRTCGSRTPWERNGELCVPAGSLDSDPGVKPSANIFTQARAAWTVVDQSLKTWPQAAS